MSRGTVVSDTSLIDLVPRSADIAIGSFPLNDGTHLDYIIVPAELTAYAVLTRYEGDKAVRHYVASKEAFDRATAEEPDLGEGKYLDFFASDATQREDGSAELNRIGQEHRDAVKADPNLENSTQTKTEAEIGNNTELLNKVVDIYKNNAWPETLAKLGGAKSLVDRFTVPDENGVDRPAHITKYFPIQNSLIPEETIYDDHWLYICSRETVSVSVARDFMYQNIFKSTKISAGIGFNLASATANIKIAAREGEPAYSNGSPAPAPKSGRFGINFSGEMLKEYRKLTIKAAMREIYEISGYRIARFPR